MPTLLIKPKKYTAETKPYSFRLPTDMVNAIDQLSAKVNRNRNEIIFLLLEFGLEHVEIVEK